MKAVPSHLILRGDAAGRITKWHVAVEGADGEALRRSLHLTDAGQKLWKVPSYRVEPRLVQVDAALRRIDLSIPTATTRGQNPTVSPSAAASR